MSKNSSVSGGGIGFCGLLAIVFITLKLCSVIDWSWWWVLSPLWLPVAIVFGVLIVIIVLLVIGKTVLYMISRKR